MEQKNIFLTKWNFKTVSLFMVLIFLPNLLGMININLLGFKIHFFQAAIFLAAILYGPKGGLVAGIVGSVNSAFMMGNPYIILFNGLLGLLVGVFYRKMNVYMSVFAAFIIQAPIIFLIDLNVVGMPIKVLQFLLVGLFISNMIWAFVAQRIKNNTIALLR